MRFLVFTLLVSLCVIAVNANDNVLPEEELLDNVSDSVYIGSESDDSVVLGDFEERTILSKFYKGLKLALRTLKGVNCSIKEALYIQLAAKSFVADCENCAVETSKKLTAVIKSCNDVINTVNDIVNYNDNICNNGNYNDGTDADKPTPSSCSKKLRSKFNTLNKQSKNTLKLVKKLPDIPGEAGVCVKASLDALTEAFTLFPTNVIECSKLTSN
ncbi:uncharacterized protein LOC119670571 [Teleopsis dalmanni]|uniref:uncharacterized protein LOC119670571 n=1 Tax=Teleopsis dalmanni TaxID=139649 RepID=UPI0018CF20DD|nr:uncharacterized protein LOC119670571 [Teleopsis dalmanni]